MQSQAVYVQADPQESPGCSQMRDQADQTQAVPVHSELNPKRPASMQTQGQKGRKNMPPLGEL